MQHSKKYVRVMYGAAGLRSTHSGSLVSNGYGATYEYHTPRLNFQYYFDLPLLSFIGLSMSG